ncbi:sensor histidine kinase [Glaciecola siphonariae]|uniref:histidine kinase n=1 Tax=Glaciecola siphonariae TaxID=521012 RepID=A0ABV9LUH5_9ALTE
MSTLSFSSKAEGQTRPTVKYRMVSSIRDVYAKRTALSANQVSAGKEAAAEARIDEENDNAGLASDCAQQQLNPNRFSHLLSVMPAGVVVIDHRGVVSLANKQASILLEEPLEGELWRDVIARAFRPQADDGHEVSMRNGKRVKIDISPLTEEKGQLIVITDLTETRELQHRLGHMQRLSSLGKMVASLAHQVRTPLSSAMLYAENIKSVQPAQSTTARFSEKLIMRLKDLESQVNDMLMFAKSGDNQIVKSMRAGDVTQASIQSLEAQFAQAKVNLEVVNTDKDAPLLCNITALSGAVSNLLSNALQAVTLAPKKQHKVTLHVSRQTVEDKQYVKFCVSDSGPGIEPSAIGRIFEPFYTTKSQGTGLGLAVVNTVAKSHKGFVHCENVHSENNDSQHDILGAAFSISVPVTPLMNMPAANLNMVEASVPANEAFNQGVSA